MQRRFSFLPVRVTLEAAALENGFSLEMDLGEEQRD